MSEGKRHVSTRLR